MLSIDHLAQVGSDESPHGRVKWFPLCLHNLRNKKRNPGVKFGVHREHTHVLVALEPFSILPAP